MSQINYTVDRVVQMKDDGQVVRFIKGSIKSTDTKPTIGIYDRSTLYEEDTGNYYVFNQRLNKWQLHDPDDGGNEGSGGGSGSGTSNDCKVMAIGYSTYDDENEIYVLDHTWQEIYDAMKSGKIVCIINNNEVNVPDGVSRGYNQTTLIVGSNFNTTNANGFYRLTTSENEYFNTDSPTNYPAKEMVT